MVFSFFRDNKKDHRKVIEMILNHDGRNWTVSNSSIRLSAPSLNELDRKLDSVLGKDLKRGQSLDVFMSFDNEVIPMWMRPYMNHYFNRILEIPLRYQV
ncbi:DUF5395 family protein [Desulfomarina sp.]